MTVPARYVFISLEPGHSKRDLFLNLSEYGDVRIMSKVSEVTSLVTDLVANLESGRQESYGSPQVVDKRPFTLPVKVNQRYPQSSASERFLAEASRPAKRPAEHMMPEVLPRAPSISTAIAARNVVMMHNIGSSAARLREVQQSLLSKHQQQQHHEQQSAMQRLQQALEKETMSKAIKSEEDLDMDGDQGAFDDFDNKNDLNDEEFFEEEPTSSISLSLSQPNEVAEALSSFMDEEGNIEMPYNPNFTECRPSRADCPLAGAKQAQCELCKRWVRITNTLSRLIAHVFMHAQKQRYVCPVEDCEFSNKSESNTRRHILTVHKKKMDPIDIQQDKKKQSESWKTDRQKWAPRCFPDHFETAPGGEMFMKVNEQSILMNTL